MRNSTCKNLQTKLQLIKRLKLEFELSLRSATNLKNIPELQNQLDFLKTEIYDFQLKLVENLETVKILEKQYQDQVEILEKLDICSKEQPFITDINGNTHWLPSFNDIKVSLTSEVLKKMERLEEPTLLLTPFGLSLATFQEFIKKNQIKLKGENKFRMEVELDKVGSMVSDDWNDLSKEKNKLAYFPDNLDPINHQGQTKSEIIKKQGGWLTSIVSGKTNLTTFPDDDNSVSLKTVRAISFQNLKNNKNKGLTPEEYFMLSLQKLKHGELMDIQVCTILNGVIIINTEERIAVGSRLFGNIKEGLLYIIAENSGQPSDYANSRTSIHLKVKK